MRQGTFTIGQSLDNPGKFNYFFWDDKGKLAVVKYDLEKVKSDMFLVAGCHNIYFVPG
jgi:hypothetical protein